MLEDILKDLIWGSIVKMATQKLIAALPFLGWGPLGLLTGAIVSMIGKAVYEAVEEYLKVEWIAFKNDGLMKAHRDAAVKLYLISKNQGAQSPEFKEAREEHKKALSKLVSFGG